MLLQGLRFRWRHLPLFWPLLDHNTPSHGSCRLLLYFSRSLATTTTLLLLAAVSLSHLFFLHTC